MLIPKALEAVYAGFPSVAQDYFDGDFSFDENVIIHPDTTFIVTVAGDSMQGAGIFDGDLLIVDRSLELTVKRLVIDQEGNPVLHPENPSYPDIHLYWEADALIWGVVLGNFHWQRAQTERPVK